MIDPTHEQRRGAAAAQVIEDARALAAVAKAGDWSDARLALAAATLLGLVVRQDGEGDVSARVAAVVPLVRFAAEAPSQPDATH